MRRYETNGIIPRLILWVLMAGCLIHLGIGTADSDIQGLSGDPVLLNSKLELLDRLVNQSASTKRIEQSDNAQAKELLQNARTSYQNARWLMEENSLDKSGLAIDEGLRSISKASQFVVDIRKQEKRYKREYAPLRARVVGFLESFEAAVVEREDNGAALLDRVKVKALMAQAQSNYEDGRYKMAGEQLDRAASSVELGLSQARDKETVVHELVFNSLQDEYAYEVQRNDSYQMLIKLMINEDSVAVSAHSYFQKKVDQNSRLRVQAQALAKNGDFNDALNVIEGATEQLVNALRMGGAGI